MSGMCAGVLLCGMTFICAHVLNGLHVESVQTPPENSRSIPVSPVTMEFGEFEGSFGNQYVGKISKDTLKSFGGSVKIMLDIKTVPEFVNAAEVYLIYPVDSDGTNMINGCAAFGDRRTADVNGLIPKGGTADYTVHADVTGAIAVAVAALSHTFAAAIKAFHWLIAAVIHARVNVYTEPLAYLIVGVGIVICPRT